MMEEDKPVVPLLLTPSFRPLVPLSHSPHLPPWFLFSRWQQMSHLGPGRQAGMKKSRGGRGAVSGVATVPLLTSRRGALLIAPFLQLFLFLSVLVTTSSHELPNNSRVKPRSRHQRAVEMMAFLSRRISTGCNYREDLYVI